LETPANPVLGSLSLEHEGVLVFTRTASKYEGARDAKADITNVARSKVWVVHLMWSTDEISLGARDADAGTI
jgi:hypothetical protein